MTKDNEIEIIDHIGERLLKLLQAKDSYTKTFLTPYLSKNVDVDVNTMVYNIKSDFPLFMGTKIERILTVFKKKNKNYQKIVNRQVDIIRDLTKILDGTTDIMHAQIDGLACDLEHIHEHDDKVLKWLLTSEFIFDDFIYANWPIDVIINMKIDNDIKLIEKDKDRIRLYVKNY
jgi:hypothetical protein